MKIIKIFTIIFSFLTLFISGSLFARSYVDLGYGFSNSKASSSAKAEGHKDLDFSSYSISVGNLSGYLGNEFNFHYAYKDSNTFFRHFSYSTIFALPADDWELYVSIGLGLLNMQYQKELNDKYKATVPIGLGFAYYFANRNSVGVSYKYYETFSDIKLSTFMVTYRRYFNLSNKNR